MVPPPGPIYTLRNAFHPFVRLASGRARGPAPRVGGVPEALGRTADGRLPGLLVSPGDATALAGALRDWLDDAALRQRLRAAARQCSGTVTSWSDTSARLSRVLAEVAA